MILEMGVRIVLAAAIVGHMVGDFILQTDWQAGNKKKYDLTGWLACLLHCFLWTASVMVCAEVWSTWLLFWLYGTHLAIDKTSFIKAWMIRFGQVEFLTKMSPLSIIVVDNTFHLLTILVGFRCFVSQ